MVYIFRPYLFTNPHLMYMTPSKGMSNISFGAQDVRRYIILCSLYLNKIIFASVPRHAKITYYVQYSTHTILFTFRDSQKNVNRFNGEKTSLRIKAILFQKFLMKEIMIT